MGAPADEGAADATGATEMDDALSERIRQLERELDALPEPKSTWFLEPGRAEAGQLARQVALASASPVLDAILRTWSGAVAVLNSRRQVVALNADYLALLGVEEPGVVLGLRPGEAVGCVHAKDQAPGGCGTGPACRTCGAAIAILAALEKGGPVERDCAFAVSRDGTRVDSEFRVRAQALDVPPERFILLSLVEVSRERRRAAFEHAFFHDLSDLLFGVVGACEEMDGGPAEITIAAADARDLADHVLQELQLQRALMTPRPAGYEARVERVPLDGVLEGIDGLFRHHPAAKGKELRVAGNGDGVVLQTDPYLLRRVITNLLLNAFEASPEGALVRLTVEAGVRDVAFRVWNPGVIPSGVAPRIFQRYFTTRKGEGRGQGTFIVKHFAEEVLGGKVGFTSTRDLGTTFTLILPRSGRP